MTRYIGCWFDDDGLHDAVIVTADDEEQAAEEVMAALQAEEDQSTGRETVDRVFVAPWEGRIAYNRRIAVERDQPRPGDPEGAS